MKIHRLQLILALPALFLSAYAIVPKTEATPRYSRVTNVERTDSSLRVGIRLQHLANYWVNIPSSTRLVAVADTTLQYRITGTENIELDKKIWMPASGYHDGTLVFEKVPDDVKVVDMIESDPADVKNNILGIHLDEPETRVPPRMITMADIVNGNGTSSENWTGLDPKQYADLGFYKKDGTTHIRGKIVDYSPRCGVGTFSIRTKDDFINDDKVNVGNINPDGSFGMDVPVTYPQFDYFELGNIHKNLFLIPGDTLSIVSCMATRIDPINGHKAEYFGYEGDTDDGVVINLLADSLLNKRYALDYLYSRFHVEASDSMKSETYKSNERLGALLDSVVADLPGLLGNLPVSRFAKDALSAIAIGKVCERMEDLELNFRFSKGPTFKKDDDGYLAYQAGDSLDLARLISTRLKHKDLVYDNPLLVCNGLVLPNRWAFNGLFVATRMATTGFMRIPGGGGYMLTDDISGLYRINDSFLDSIGVGNCFVAQMMRTSSLINNLKTFGTPSYNQLERSNRLISHLIRHNDCQPLNDILMSEYTNFVKDVMIAENALCSDNDSAILIEGTAEGELLEKIISPYKGNVLFLDFWGIGCGPCRAGMIDQKPMLEQLADKPFKALYIANAEDGLDACKRWLRNEEIKGEHIFVTGDDWKRLCGLFNISGIPHGVLIGKDGRIINPNYHFNLDNHALKKALAE